MSPHEEREILRWSDGLARGVEISQVRSDDPRSAEFDSFRGELARLAPRLTIREERAESPDAPPAIRIGSGVEYLLIPLGPQLKPFLDAVAMRAGEAPVLDADARTSLAAVRQPAALKLYVAPGCPHCPTAVKEIIPLAFADDRIRLSVIDGALFSEMAEADGISGAPTLILDGGFRWTGTIRPAEVAEVLADRDPARLTAETLEGIVQDGKAESVAAMMRDRGELFTAFLDLLTHEKWPTRLGAMVAMEHLAEDAPELAAEAVDPLWKRFGDLDERVRGDMLYLFGEIGGPGTRWKLETVLKGPGGEEMKEAAREAIVRLAERKVG